MKTDRRHAWAYTRICISGFYKPNKKIGIKTTFRISCVRMDSSFFFFGVQSPFFSCWSFVNLFNMPFECGNAHISGFFFRFNLHVYNMYTAYHSSVTTAQHSMNAWFIVLKMHMYNVYRYRSTYLDVLPTTNIQTHLYALRAPCSTITKPNETFSGARTKDFWTINRHTSVRRWKAEPGDEDGKNEQRMEKCIAFILPLDQIFSAEFKRRAKSNRDTANSRFYTKKHAYR